MTNYDVYLLSPEISLVGLALLIVALDLVVKQKGILAVVAIVGLSLPIALGILLWDDVDSQSNTALIGIFGTLTIDKFALFFKFLILGITALVVMASVDYMNRLRYLQGEYLALILFSATGMMLLAATTELISIYISLELTTLPLIALSTFLMTPRSSEAGIKFLVLGAVSSALLLYGMVLIYGFAGSTHLAIISESIKAAPGNNMPFGGYALLLSIILIIAGFGFKISSVPFQMWVPDVYEGAPTPVVAFLSVASKAAGFAILLRVLYVAFPILELDWALLFAALAVLTMTTGNVVAMTQTNIKRLLGYSTIAHAGYMLVGLAAVASRTETGEGVFGPGSLLFYLAGYAATNLAAFFAIMAISNRIDSDKISDFAGMGRRAPVLALTLTFAMVSLIGIPPTSLFIGKILLFSAAVNSDLVWLAVIGVINSVLSAYYYLRVVRVMYMTEPPSKEAERFSTPLSFTLALTISGLAILIIGVAPQVLLWVTDVAAEALIP